MKQVVRHMVRGVLLSAEAEVLLMQMAFPWYDTPVWIAPGGGIDSDEAAPDALRRELLEETGRSELPVGPLVLERSFVIEHDGRIVHAHERYFLVATARFEPQPAAFEPHEVRWFRAFRWWPVDEFVSTAARVEPDALPGLVRRLSERRPLRA